MIKLHEGLIKRAAKQEDVSPDLLKKGVETGRIVIPKNKKRDIARISAIGEGLLTKVNANIGLSSGNSNIKVELAKMEVAVKAGADAVMDLSTGPDIRKLRKQILETCPVPLGTVPVYEIACDGGKNFRSMKEKDFIGVLHRQAEEGVDFFTVHAGITAEAVMYAARHPRIINIVSRGGALLADWMVGNKKENPFLSHFDEVIEIAKRFDITLSLGDSLRPGAIADATDRLQIQELILLGELQQRAFSRGVQVMIEGPGHVPLDQIETNVRLEKSICHGAPFYVLGPLVTDAAPGYDHIVSAIGGALAASYGADFLCYVTPSEHLKLPDIEDVRAGVVASKIAAHAADIVKKIPSAIKRDMDISKARARRDWAEQFRLAIDPELPERIRSSSAPGKKDICTMCSEYCSLKISEEALGKVK